MAKTFHHRHRNCLPSGCENRQMCCGDGKVLLNIKQFSSSTSQHINRAAGASLERALRGEFFSFIFEKNSRIFHVARNFMFSINYNGLPIQTVKFTLTIYCWKNIARFDRMMFKVRSG